jgi:hypothetical protein
MTATKFQRAYESFHTELPELLAQGLRGQWALYDGPTRVEVSANRDRLYELGRARGMSEEDIFVDLIAPEPEDIDADSLLFR